MSNLQISPFSLRLCQKSITSLAISEASKICLPLTKAFWSTETTFPRTFFNLFVNTLAKNLYGRPKVPKVLNSPFLWN